MSRELREIVERFDTLAREGARSVLATVIDVRGSSYRLPGARMLVDENGDTAGTVSGGCLEADILERAKRVMATGAAEVFVYDTRAIDDSVFGLNMGCRGVIRILLEPAGAEIAEFLRGRPEARHAAALATVVVPTAGGRPRAGARLLVDERGETAVGLGAEDRQALAAECAAALAEGRSRLQTFDLGEVFVEVVAAPLPIVIFGAGHDAVPVARLAKELGWRVVVMDHRPAYATRERFQTADDVILARPEEVGERVEVDERTAIVLMTHNYQHDLTLLRFALASPARYVGALGPRRRTEQLLDELARDGFAPPERALDRLYAPIGVDIGAEAPEEIALSIVAEIRAVTNGRGAGMLRKHSGAIHGRADDARPLPFAERESVV